MMWRVCERLHMRPPGVKENFEENLPWVQAMLLGYEELRNFEENPPLDDSGKPL